ncbi:hypothetical protein Mnod_6896 [Methylobacterium nodulans ORS 2060]|uniref:Uncharacterized protein n=1 Tax=Methylobacterium nodulans (strain LMG 21967 / CNCM I-2342 / ORS 2060) TaxID=460265 RepID=B8IHH8_METNO|nr:hypothetical protein Mnod_6896 [Methylobacterium nodulans ORS 2060]
MRRAETKNPATAEPGGVKGKASLSAAIDKHILRVRYISSLGVGDLPCARSTGRKARRSAGRVRRGSAMSGRMAQSFVCFPPVHSLCEPVDRSGELAAVPAPSRGYRPQRARFRRLGHGEVAHHQPAQLRQSALTAPTSGYRTVPHRARPRTVLERAPPGATCRSPDGSTMSQNKGRRPALAGAKQGRSPRSLDEEPHAVDARRCHHRPGEPVPAR